MDLFGSRDTLDLGNLRIGYHRLDRLEKAGVVPSLDRLPRSIKVLLECALRRADGFLVTEDDVTRLAKWAPKVPLAERREVPFLPTRVILQDFTGVPVVADLAAMRDAAARLQKDARRINPVVPVDLVIDHSVQVDYDRSADALTRNVALEYARNRERYAFLRWGQQALSNFRVVPPSTGIVHQVNLEYLAQVVAKIQTTHAGGDEAFLGAPDTVVGTDSHTTMVGGLGVLGWGVGGIEAEAVMLGQPIYMVLPEVVGVNIKGKLREGATATDLTLTITERLRKLGVVDKFVEFFGEGLDSLTLEDRATIANMAPEYGATCGFFPIDGETLLYLRRTGRAADHVDLIEKYAKAQGLFRSTVDPMFDAVLEVDLAGIEPSVAGPKRPHDRLALGNVSTSFAKALAAPVAQDGFGVANPEKQVKVSLRSGESTIGHGSVAIAAITSCTNTSNPSVLIAAGLLARAARKAGLRVPVHVKTSLAPGSQVVTEYLRKSGLLEDLEALGFNVVGYGCTTCIGNSGPLDDELGRAITKESIVAAAVLSGNRNFEGRVHPLVRANYLASPPLVVAYALAGTVSVDLATEPLGIGSGGVPIYLRDLWPTTAQIREVFEKNIDSAMFKNVYGHVFKGDELWQGMGAPASASKLATIGVPPADPHAAVQPQYAWDPSSTYIRRPPFFESLSLGETAVAPIVSARVLAMFGDSITTDHISPAGDIAAEGPAARYLGEAGLKKADFNSYGSRRGNHEVMMRGTFANIRIKNKLLPGVEGNVTLHFPSGEKMSIFDAAMRYREAGTPLVILAGKEYGSGSSRDWAAKGPLLLGVRAVIAEGFERIHRSNLVFMGVLPLEFLPGENAAKLGLTGEEAFTIQGIGEPTEDDIKPRQELTVLATHNGSEKKFKVKARIDSRVESSYYKNGGILPTVLRNLLGT